MSALKRRARALATLKGLGWDADKDTIKLTDSDGNVIEVKSFLKDAEAKSFAVEQVDDNTIMVQWVPEGEGDGDAAMDDDEDEDDDKMKSALKSFEDKLNLVLKQNRAADDRTKANGTNPHPSNSPIEVKSVAERAYEDAYNRANGRKMLAPESALALGHLFVGYVHEQGKAGSRVAPEVRQKSREALARIMAKSGYGSKQNATFPASAGGALLATEFAPDLINLVNQFGTAAQYARVHQMTQDLTRVPRATEGVEFYFEDEGSSRTTSKSEWSNVKLEAKSATAIVKMSKEIDQASIINLGNYYGGELARAAARKIDQCFFIGDGTSAFGGMVGVTRKFVLGTSAGAINTVVGGGTSANTWVDYIHGHIQNLVSVLPNYARTGNARFYGNERFFYTVLNGIAAGKGGVTQTEVVNGNLTRRFDGIEFVHTEVMNGTANTSTDTVDLLYGDLTLAGILGERLGIEIDVSDQRYWDEFNLGIRAMIRFDVNIHDIGNASTTGPVVALWQT